jgi:16S rRNA (guanine966-N2)-methyltransferase
VHSNKGKIRIIGGEYRGRRIRCPIAPGSAPDARRVRETLFNWLGQSLDGLCCLDLFAGSGALGFEAASRGAQRVVMVEQDRAVFESSQDHGTHRREPRRARARRCVRLPAARRGASTWFSSIRPSGRMRCRRCSAAERRARHARVRESSEPFAPGEPWRELKRSRAGQVSYQLFEWRSDDQGGLPGNV